MIQVHFNDKLKKFLASIVTKFNFVHQFDNVLIFNVKSRFYGTENKWRLRMFIFFEEFRELVFCIVGGPSTLINDLFNLYLNTTFLNIPSLYAEHILIYSYSPRIFLP